MNKFQKGGRRNDRDDRQEMHKATCAECGNGCEVPFRPNGKRPVLCSKCYTEAGGHGYDSDRADKPRREDREDRYAAPRPRTEAPAIPAALEAQLKEINEKLDVLIEVLTMDESELDEEDFESMEEIDEEATGELK